jgi:hypothetical protein
MNDVAGIHSSLAACEAKLGYDNYAECCLQNSSGSEPSGSDLRALNEACSACTMA